MKRNFCLWWNFLFCLLLLGFTGCKDGEDTSTDSYDPDLPVTISSFIPESGGANTQLVVYGDNFGNDASKVKVKVGGKDALIINVKNNCLYCFVPAKSGGKIEIKVENSEPAISEKEFKYEFKKVVSTLCGYVDELGQGSVLPEGSFDELQKIESLSWLTIDPKDKNIMYGLQDKGEVTNSIFKFDLKNRYMSTVCRSGANNVKRFMSADWFDDDNLIISTPKNGTNATTPGSIMLKRDEDFKNINILTYWASSQSTIYNPISGYLYYSSYIGSSLYGYDYTTWGPGQNIDHNEYLFKFSGTAGRMMVRHPTDSYIYIISPQLHSIHRSDFDFVTKTYSTPYIVCGGSGAGYADKIGVNAKLNAPWQGCFVRNKERTEGDLYDFYFCDKNNHCIRILSPDGVVSTFAGRGSRSINAQYYGYVDGDLREDARFNEPWAITYDEDSDTFYIYDKKNFRIRKIATEERDEEISDDSGDISENSIEN